MILESTSCPPIAWIALRALIRPMRTRAAVLRVQWASITQALRKHSASNVMPVDSLKQLKVPNVLTVRPVYFGLPRAELFAIPVLRACTQRLLEQIPATTARREHFKHTPVKKVVRLALRDSPKTLPVRQVAPLVLRGLIQA